jgi:hypothetical protein
MNVEDPARKMDEQGFRMIEATMNKDLRLALFKYVYDPERIRREREEYDQWLTWKKSLEEPSSAVSQTYTQANQGSHSEEGRRRSFK